MKQTISMIVFVLILGSVLTSALVAVDDYTAPRIEANARVKTQGGVLKALGIPYLKEEISRVFEDQVEAEQKDGKMFYRSADGRIAFGILGNGLWGPIRGVIALEEDLETIAGLTIVHQEETPGLGSRIGDADYLEGFRNKKIVPGITIVSSGQAAGKNEVDGITGATLSCKAFENMLNSESKKYLALLEGTEK